MSHPFSAPLPVRAPHLAANHRRSRRARETALAAASRRVVLEMLEGRRLFDGGDFSLDFIAAAPFTYDHSTGGGAYDDRTIGKDEDVVESLEGGDFAAGDFVTYFVAITVDAGATGVQTIELDLEFLANTTGQEGVGHEDIIGAFINYGPIAGGEGEGAGGTDAGNIDDGNSVATLVSETPPSDPFHNGTTDLLGTVSITDLEAGEQVILRVDVLLGADPTANPTGNLQAALLAARVTAPAPDTISGGQQTIPFKQAGAILVEPGIKSGLKFLDVNADGTRDADGADDVAGNGDDEVGLEGWEIRAYDDTDGDGFLSQTEFDAGSALSDTTDSNGEYSLTLVPGDYIIVEVLQSGWTQSAPGGPSVLGAGLDTSGEPVELGANGYAITLAGGDEHPGNDFGNYERPTNSGIKFHDVNADGTQDADGENDIAGDSDDEAPLENWEIRAYEDTDGDGFLSQSEFDAGAADTDTTNASGQYTLIVDPGDYIIVEVLQSGWFQSAPGGPSVLAAGLDTSAEPVVLGPYGYATTLVSGDAPEFDDFGNYQNATKSGVKFHDKVPDGVRDADGANNVLGNSDDEVLLAGWDIRAYEDADGDGFLQQAEFDAGPADTDTTDALGAYELSLAPGDYIVVEVLQAGWIQTAPFSSPVLAAGLNTGVISLGDDGYSITLSSNEYDRGNDFGNLHLGGTGGRTPGFWRNKNGNAQLNDNGGAGPELLLLRNLNLKTKTGGNFQPTTVGQLNTWLKDATATNMAYMLSVHLACMALNVEAGLVSGSDVVFAPQLLPFAPITGLGGTGIISISDLMTAANNALGADGFTPSGDVNRAKQAALKSALDDANNNLNFVI